MHSIDGLVRALIPPHPNQRRQELYEGEAAVAAHETTDRMQALLPKLQGMCKSLRLVHGLVAAETL